MPSRAKKVVTSLKEWAIQQGKKLNKPSTTTWTRKQHRRIKRNSRGMVLAFAEPGQKGPCFSPTGPPLVIRPRPRLGSLTPNNHPYREAQLRLRFLFEPQPSPLRDPMVGDFVRKKKRKPSVKKENSPRKTSQASLLHQNSPRKTSQASLLQKNSPRKTSQASLLQKNSPRRASPASLSHQNSPRRKSSVKTKQSKTKRRFFKAKRKSSR